jgi:hypothetical protein
METLAALVKQDGATALVYTPLRLVRCRDAGA